MVEGIAIAWAYAVRGLEARVLILAAALLAPVPTAVAAAILVLRNRSSDGMGGVRFSEAVADELRAGSSIRGAIASAASSTGEPQLAALARSGEPLRRVAAEAARSFPSVGEELAVCIERSAFSGGPGADLFDEVAGLALAEQQIGREIDTAVAPARVATAVMVGTGLFGVWRAVASGNLSLFVEHQAQRVVALAGVVLLVAAVVTGLLIIRRSR